MEPLQALERAANCYESRLAAVAPDQWGLMSVCTAWTVKDLADHVLGGNRFAVGLLAGQTIEEAFGSALGLGFDGDPVEAFRTSVEAQAAAFGADGALDRTVHHPAGEISGAQFLGFRVGDLLLHGWDLARSTGGDDTLDAELVPMVWETYLPVAEAGRARGTFGACDGGSLSQDAPLGDRLLDLTGRRS